MRRALVALALLVLLAHAAALPSSFSDLDAINFALGVRDFDVAKHQPHPPGYPIFIVMAKASTALLDAAGVAHAEVRGLAVWSVVSGALLIPLLFLLFRSLVADDRTAVCAAAVAGLSPLIWMNAVRPLSDMTGLAFVIAVQALLAPVALRRAGPRARRLTLYGAVLAGLAIGVRSQSFVLTLPLLGLALVVPHTGLTLRDRLAAVAAVTLSVLAWMIPLFVVSGGVEAYLQALGNQAGEDFTGVVMLWTTRTPRVAIDAIAYTFLWPWGALAAGWVVMAVAVLGALRLAFRQPGVLGVLIVAFAPYAVFHLLFQETLTTRYAAPLVVPVALLVMDAAAATTRGCLHAGCAALAAWSLVTAAPATWQYASRPTPSAASLRDALASTGEDGLIGLHAVLLRAEQWYHDNASGRVIRALHGEELAALVDRWRREPDRTITFLADPRRSDLAMLDPRARAAVRHYRWGFEEFPLLGGVRPGEVELLTLRPPGWMLDDGWALTAEIGGQTARRGAGPHRRPAVAWIRSRPGEATLMIGGRNLGPAGGADARVTLMVRGHVWHEFVVSPGAFFERLALPAGTLGADVPWIPLEVTAGSLGDGAVPVGLEQFDLQSPGVPMAGVSRGWQEPEYNPTSGRTWRWMSDDAELWVQPVGRDVTLRIAGESPLRYFDGAPTIRVSVAGTLLTEARPDDDFSIAVTIPATLLAGADGVVRVTSDRAFVPGDGDQRTLALRVYRVGVE